MLFTVRRWPFTTLRYRLYNYPSEALSESAVDSIINRAFKVFHQFIPEMLNEAKCLRPKLRPNTWGRGRGRGRGQDIEVDTKAKFKEA